MLNRIEKYVDRIDKELDGLNLNRKPDQLYKPCEYLLENGGKRLRPVFVLMGAGLCGGGQDKAVPAALAVELVHNFTLVHDDIMDEAESRRGRQTLHIKWDLPVAILAGDLLFVEAFRQLQSYHHTEIVENETVLKLYDTLLDSVRTVCEGQAMDMEFESNRKVSSSDYLTMIEAKTAALIRASFMMGGITAGAGQSELEKLRELGTTIGLAFQIQDDLLDVVGDPEIFGKSRGGDILEGKKTYLLLYALEQSNETVQNELNRLMNQPDKAAKDVDSVIQLYQKSGAIKQAEKLILQYYMDAENQLNQFEDSVFKEDLASLLDFMKNRDY